MMEDEEECSLKEVLLGAALLLLAIPLLTWHALKDEWLMLVGKKARPPYDPEKDDWYP